MAPRLKIRPLAAADAQAFWKLRLEALEQEPLAFGESAAEHRATPVSAIAERLRSGLAQGSFVLGAFAGRRLVGTIGFARNTRAKARHKGLVWGVYVQQAWRRRGVGRALLRELLQRVREQGGVEQVTLTVAAAQTAAVRLYAGLGFRTYGREPRALKIGNTYVDEDLMALPLEASPALTARPLKAGGSTRPAAAAPRARRTASRGSPRSKLFPSARRGKRARL